MQRKRIKDLSLRLDRGKRTSICPRMPALSEIWGFEEAEEEDQGFFSGFGLWQTDIHRSTDAGAFPQWCSRYALRALRCCCCCTQERHFWRCIIKCRTIAGGTGKPGNKILKAFIESFSSTQGASR